MKQEDQGTMNERERIETLLRRERPDRIPIWPFAITGFAGVYSGKTIKDAYIDPEASLEAQRKTCRDLSWVFVPMIGYASFGAWEFGGEIKMPEGKYHQAPTIFRHPVETEEDAWNLKAPEGPTGYIPILEKFYELASKQSLDNEPFNVMIGAGACFDTAANIAGTDRFLKWMLKKPELAHHILRVVTDWSLAGLEISREVYGVEGVLPIGGEAQSSNQLISPKQLREFVLPYDGEVMDRALSLGYRNTYQHLCGEQNMNLPFWAELNFGDPGMISVGHEVNLETAAKHFPDDIIVGNLEPSLILSGTPETVYDETKRVVMAGMELPCGYIFSPGCDLPPYAPIENVRMMNKAVDDFGWYDR